MNQLYPQQSDHPLFRYFSPEEREKIEKIGKVVKIANDGFLIRESELDSTLFAVEDGHLEIMGTRNGKPVMLATVGPGDVLGEVSFIDNSPRSVSVKAGEDTVVRSWDRKTLSDVLAKDPQLLAKFAIAMSELLVERLREAVKRQGNFRPV